MDGASLLRKALFGGDDMPSSSYRKKGEVNFIGTVEKDSAKITIFPEFCDGLQGLENYSHLIILYWFHQRDTPGERRILKVTPKRHPGAPRVGVFSSRSPSRPNPVGLCVVELARIENCTLEINGLDAVEGSPVIDIKPYLPRADSISNAKTAEWASQGPTT
jgi:tRNA-Thr(GGU) m(6)t(6)A37 methyltransferase TsaA